MWGVKPFLAHEIKLRAEGKSEVQVAKEFDLSYTTPWRRMRPLPLPPVRGQEGSRNCQAELALGTCGSPFGPPLRGTGVFPS